MRHFIRAVCDQLVHGVDGTLRAQSSGTGASELVARGAQGWMQSGVRKRGEMAYRKFFPNGLINHLVPLDGRNALKVVADHLDGDVRAVWIAVGGDYLQMGRLQRGCDLAVDGGH